MLEDLGLRVIEEVPTRLQGGDGESCGCRTSACSGPGDRPLDLDAAAASAWPTASPPSGAARPSPTRSTGSSSAAGLDWRQVADPARLPQLPPAHRLALHRGLPERRASRPTRAITAKLDAAVRAALRPRRASATRRPRRRCARRSSPTSTRSRRSTTTASCATSSALIDATVRTNAYQPGRGAMAFKLRSADVPAMPQPAPLFEIYVYAPDMEGIHLRGGRIARGGIRWSDREDYRTEVFGLMRAQMTKNAVIVPDGRQGRVLPASSRPSDPAALRDEVERQYVALRRGAARPHRQPRRRRGRAPDRRARARRATTPTSSSPPTRAPRRSPTPPTRSPSERGFWLGDAFASGGSTGYDHKALGHHRPRRVGVGQAPLPRARARPASATPFTVVGIGDMSGDVFGNGMLLSRPHPARRRLRPPPRLPRPRPRRRPRRSPSASGCSTLPGSSWDDYDRDADLAPAAACGRAARSRSR